MLDYGINPQSNPQSHKLSLLSQGVNGKGRGQRNFRKIFLLPDSKRRGGNSGVSIVCGSRHGIRQSSLTGFFRLAGFFFRDRSILVHVTEVDVVDEAWLQGTDESVTQ